MYDLGGMLNEFIGSLLLALVALFIQFIISALLEVAPWVADWWDEVKHPGRKPMIMLILAFAAMGLMYFMAYYELTIPIVGTPVENPAEIGWGQVVVNSLIWGGVTWAVIQWLFPRFQQPLGQRVKTAKAAVG